MSKGDTFGPWVTHGDVSETRCVTPQVLEYKPFTERVTHVTHFYPLYAYARARTRMQNSCGAASPCVTSHPTAWVAFDTIPPLADSAAARSLSLSPTGRDVGPCGNRFPSAHRYAGDARRRHGPPSWPSIGLDEFQFAGGVGFDLSTVPSNPNRVQPSRLRICRFPIDDLSYRPLVEARFPAVFVYGPHERTRFQIACDQFAIHEGSPHCFKQLVRYAFQRDPGRDAIPLKCSQLRVLANCRTWVIGIGECCERHSLSPDRIRSRSECIARRIGHAVFSTHGNLLSNRQ